LDDTRTNLTDGCLYEGIFEGLECLGMVRTPCEQGVLASEADQGDDVRKSHNESAVEVGKAEKCLDCLEVSWGQPDADSISFGSVHGDACGGDHKAQELDLLSVEHYSGLECKSYS